MSNSRPPGRPPKEPEYFLELARLYVRGRSLRKALKRLGTTLTEAEMRNLYRLKRWKELVAEADSERKAELAREWNSGSGLYIPKRAESGE
jgi:hypothetical protein